MANTQRMGWPAISQFADPWFDAWTALLTAMDNSGFASREDRHLIFAGGGNFTFTAGGTNTLAWDATIEIASPIAGFVWQIPAGSVSMEEGDVFYATLVRRPTANLSVVVASAQQIPNSDAALAIAFRRNNQIYFRTGGALGAGDTAEVFDAAVGGGGGVALTFVPLGLNESTDQSTFQALGSFSFDPDTFSEIRFVTIANVTDGSLTGEIELFNLTDLSTVVTNTYAGVLAPTKVDSGPLVLTSGERLYEVRHRVTGGTPPTDRVITASAILQLQ